METSLLGGEFIMDFVRCVDCMKHCFIGFYNNKRIYMCMEEYKMDLMDLDKIQERVKCSLFEVR